MKTILNIPNFVEASNTTSLVNNLSDVFQINIVNSFKNLKDKIILLPGMGSFDRYTEKLHAFDISPKFFSENIIIGICIGMQTMLTDSEESKSLKGINYISGSVKKICSENYKVPIMGKIKINFNDDFFKSKFDNKSFYFAHSYFCEILDKECKIIASYCLNDLIIPCIIKKNNYYGLQFHPELSGNDGINLIKTIINT